MSIINGVVIGLVKSLKDPQNLGRVEVHFPWLADNHKSFWARIATMMAGAGRGSWFMPEIDDEVLVAFEHGDVQCPCIVGFLWNGKDKPPNSDINASVRRIQTVCGHVLEFDDNSGKERILIKTQGGQEIELKDKKTAQITIKTKKGQTITINDTPAGITLSSPAGSVAVNCLQADITAKSLLSVKAPFVEFSNVVQASTVVGGAYTPAPGNTFGQ